MKIKIRQAKNEDIPKILLIEEIAWGKEKSASKEMIESRIKTFPGGALVAESNKEIIGVVFTERVDYDFNNSAFTWYEITDNGFIKNSHKADGRVVYGVDLSVMPSYQHLGVGTQLLEGIGKLAIRYNVKYGMLGGRLPLYYKYANKMTVEEYINAVTDTEKGHRSLDPEIDFYKKSGLKIIKAIPNYFKDPESLDYGVLLLWENPFYNKYYRWLAAKLFKV
ncbi:MAG: GNAT family N-acetyltransferase [Patescibacteria group bacterium]